MAKVLVVTAPGEDWHAWWRLLTVCGHHVLVWRDADTPEACIQQGRQAHVALVSENGAAVRSGEAIRSLLPETQVVVLHPASPSKPRIGALAAVPGVWHLQAPLDETTVQHIVASALSRQRHDHPHPQVPVKA